MLRRVLVRTRRPSNWGASSIYSFAATFESSTGCQEQSCCLGRRNLPPSRESVVVFPSFRDRSTLGFVGSFDLCLILTILHIFSSFATPLRWFGQKPSPEAAASIEQQSDALLDRLACDGDRHVGDRRRDIPYSAGPCKEIIRP